MALTEQTLAPGVGQADEPLPGPPSSVGGRLVGGDRPGQIETHGIDFIPADARHGRPRELFVIWAASNINYLYIVLGGALMLMGLDVWQAIAVIVAGNLFWALVGLLAVSGPASGTPSEVVTRAMYGVRANRLYNAVLGWGVGVAYEAINLSIGALAAFALVTHWGADIATPIRVVLVLAIALVTFTISVYGHATIVKLSGWFTALLFAASVLTGVYIVTRAHLAYHAPPSTAVHGVALWAAIAVGITLIASAPLSWGTSADYARYLPADSSRRGVIAWTAIGGFVPAVALGTLGALAGTVVNMTDPQTSLHALLPAWFYPLFLLVIVLGSITNNVLTAYSTGLCLQAVGIPWKRSVTVIFDAVVAIGITCYALFVSNFLDTLNNLLALSVAFLGPALAIYGVDILMRRNRYDGAALHDERRDGPFWYRGGCNVAGCTALAVASLVALLCVNTTLIVGPIAHALGGADISSVVGPLLAAVLYAAGVRLQRRGEVADV